MSLLWIQEHSYQTQEGKQADRLQVQGLSQGLFSQDKYPDAQFSNKLPAMGFWNLPFDHWLEVGIKFETQKGIGNHPEKCLVHGTPNQGNLSGFT